MIHNQPEDGWNAFKCVYTASCLPDPFFHRPHQYKHILVAKSSTGCKTRE